VRHTWGTAKEVPIAGRWRFLVRSAGYYAECCEAKRQERSTSTVGEEAEVADADEAFREQVQQESPQELVEWRTVGLWYYAARGNARTAMG
jgi:hypothetical protein